MIKTALKKRLKLKKFYFSYIQKNNYQSDGYKISIYQIKIWKIQNENLTKRH